ncbi:SDR family oxidoreductase [Streptacidiphilus griseoplanus]|uniref:SDR family oxidoreductase n=1 Tax=Peterkaempfera griseoplana TaxID=66896 RepID=UPI0006E12716|nr:SDR family oxidoreductase [Peterkaempfera griseoplana]
MFQGQQVIVMGASHGIGEATAAAFAADGAAVTITGRSKERLESAAERIGHPVTTAELDATDPAAVTAFFEAVDHIDHLVVSLGPGSGHGAFGPFTELAEESLRAVFDGKFFAHFRVVQAAVPKLTRTASITLVTALSSRGAMPGTAGLAAVNGALDAMVPPLATELAPVRVNAVSPGVVDTAWWASMPEADRTAFFEKAAAHLPVRRVGRPEDIAHSVLYLAGNGNVTGTVLPCDGGANLATGV